MSPIFVPCPSAPVITGEQFFAAFWYESEVTAGSAFDTLEFSVDTGQPHGFYMFHSPPAQGDAAEISVALLPGNYRFSILGRSGTNLAEQTVYFDGVAQSVFDWYDVANNAGVILSATVTITNPITVVSLRTDSRNVNSTGWFTFTTRLWFDKNGVP